MHVTVKTNMSSSNSFKMKTEYFSTPENKQDEKLLLLPEIKMEEISSLHQSIDLPDVKMEPEETINDDCQSGSLNYQKDSQNPVHPLVEVIQTDDQIAKEAVIKSERIDPLENTSDNNGDCQNSVSHSDKAKNKKSSMQRERVFKKHQNPNKKLKTTLGKSKEIKDEQQADLPMIPSLMDATLASLGDRALSELTSSEEDLLIASAVVGIIEIEEKMREFCKPQFSFNTNLQSRLQNKIRDLMKDLILYDMDELNLEYRESGFKNFFQIKSSDFEDLLSLIAPTIAKKVILCGNPIPAHIHLAVTLRYLAMGDSCCSLSDMFKISIQSISNIILNVCDAICISLQDYIKI